jgi:hypothetical protein
MPTKHQRIAVTNDPELAQALARVARFYDGAPTSRIVHDLALKGAEVVERENAEHQAAIEWLIEFSTKRTDVIDWDALENRRNEAWGY